MMIKECNQLIQDRHMLMEQVKICKKEKIKCNNIMKQYKSV